MNKQLLALTAVLLVSPAYAQSTLYSNSTSVGIGTTLPGGTLDVEGGTAAASTSGVPVKIIAQSAGSGNQNGGNIILTPGAATGTGTAGGVAIGTSSPDYVLDVEGTGTNIMRALSNTSALAYLDVYNINSGTGTNGSIMRLVTENSSGTGQTSVDFLKYADGYFEIDNNDASGIVAFGTDSTERMRIASTGDVGIANSSPAYLLHIGSATSSGAVAALQNSSGICTHTPSASSETVSCSSDKSLKKDIEDSTGALAWADSLRIRDFTIKATGERQTGVIAQETMINHPEMVHEDKNGLRSVDEPNPWVLVKAIQDLHDITLKQEEEITSLRAEIAQTQEK